MGRPASSVSLLKDVLFWSVFILFLVPDPVLGKEAQWGGFSDNPQDNAQRFLVLANYNQEAVLDRETGLVWERTPDTFSTLTLNNGINQCRINRRTGGKLGWRLPTVEEVLTLFKPIPGNQGTVFQPPPPSPIFNYDPNDASGTKRYWTATTFVHDLNQAYGFLIFLGNANLINLSKTSSEPSVAVWCVRGGSAPERP